MESERGRFPIFKGENYSDWKFRVKVLLDEKDLLRCIEKPLEELLATVNSTENLVSPVIKREEKKCKSTLIQCIGDECLEYIKDKATSFEIFKTLEDVFERKGIKTQLYCRKQLLSFKLDENDKLENHFLQFDKLIRNLREAGAHMSENDIVCHLLLTLPPSYDVISTALDTLDDSKLTVNFVKSKLLDHELKNCQTSDLNDTAFSGTKYKVSVTCNYCGRKGHYWRDCEKRKKNFKKNSKFENSRVEKVNICDGESDTSEVEEENEEEDEFVFLSSSDEPTSTVTWFLDSGATEHMTNDRSIFKTFNKLEKPVKIAIAEKGQTLIARFSGDVAAFTSTGQRVIFQKILYVPELRQNLFSVRKIEEKGYKIIFFNGKAKIFKGNKLVFAASKLNRLYEFNLIIPAEKVESCVAEEDLTTLWHKRLGHINKTSLTKMVQKNMVSGLPLTAADISEDFQNNCEGCIAGKQTKLPFKSNMKGTTSKSLEIVHSDICGPISPKTYNNKRYLLTFIDDYTHFTIIYLLAQKDEFFNCFQDYESKVTTLHNLKIINIRCDNAGEYKSNDFQNFVKIKGINVQYTVPYTPELNGKAERMNRTILEKARCLMLTSKVKKIFWGEAVLTCVYLINRSPTNSIVNSNLTPAELWYGKKPDISKLRVFGSIAYAHIPDQLRSKLDSKTRKCIMMGYSTNGYRLWDLEKKKLILARDVIFNEESVKDEFLPSTVEIEPDRGEQNGETDLLKKTSEDVEKPKEVNDESAEQEEEGNEKVLPKRSDRIKQKPAWHNDYEFGALALLGDSTLDTPSTFQEAMRSPQKDEWTQAIESELESLKTNETWELVKPPKDKNVIGNKWVFRIKTDESGNPSKFKARLVAKGYSQIKNEDYTDIFAPVVKLSTVRTLLSIANHSNLIVESMDVKTAFLNGFLDEELYMKQPEGCEDPSKPQLVCKLKRSLYGLKQAPRAWNRRFHQFMQKQKFQQSKNDYCLYSRCSGNSKLYLLLYVDDILIIGDSKDEVQKFKNCLSETFQMTDLGPLSNFLGIQIKRNESENILTFNQRKYILTILKKFDMENCNSVSTPIEPKLNLERGKEEKLTTKPYRELLGSLMYIMLGTRPDISFSLNYLSRFASCATDHHWKYLKRVLQYLKSTSDFELTFRRNLNGDALVGFVDADWASDANDRHSTSGYLFKILDNCVSWTTKKQPTISLSSTEAEYIALSYGACEGLWMKNLLTDLNIEVNTFKLNEDNQSCIYIAKDPQDHRRMKHVDVRFHFVRELTQNQILQIEYISSEHQLADILTKGLPFPKFKKFRDAILGI